MISHFSVKNFRSFKGWTHFSLSSDKKYTFNENAVNNTIIRHAMLYGENSSGKSNLGLAMLDISRHLSQKTRRYPELGMAYLNGDSDCELAEFKFQLVIESRELLYEYGKNHAAEIVYETLTIDEQLVLQWDKRNSNTADIRLLGAESLKRDLSDNITSLVSYVLHNAALDDSPPNSALLAFVAFVQGMAFLKTMHDVNDYAGMRPSKQKNLTATIINELGVDKLQTILNQAGIPVSLGTYDSPDGQRIMQKLANTSLDFFSVASSGTFSLMLLAVWLHKMEQGEITFVYIDEFDAFYHHKLARAMVKHIAALPGQTVLSSHNTSVMSNNLLRPDCYFELKNGTITPLNELSDREIRKAHNLEKMYRAGAFDG